MDSHAASLWQHLQPERHRHLLPAVCERLLQARCLRPQVLLQLRAGVQLWGKMELSDATWGLHLWQQGNDFEQKALSRLGMTGRQSEVLSWVAAGKTNVEIGLILGISSRTVQKHLETIYRLLGVETRVAAINRCRELAAVD
jgi:DNA-binding CsgD family transcriptional regulator